MQLARAAAHTAYQWAISCYCSVAVAQTHRCLVLCRIYDLYTDYVLKNPFYEVEMPVRCELFDTNLFQVIGNVHRRWGIAQA